MGLNKATYLSCKNCQAMPCGYIDYKRLGGNKRVYYCGYHMKELEGEK